MTARATWRGRCEESYVVKTQTLPADLMTLVLSHARKFTCAEVRNVRMCGVGFTHPSGATESPLPVGGTKNQKVHCSSQLNASHHFSDDCHHDEDELDEVVRGYHLHPVFGSTRSARSLNLLKRLIWSLP